MYEERFGFAGSPFRLNPDPKFFFGSKSHNKAMAYLHYGLRQGEGFIVITGEIGAGKSMLIGHLLDQLDRSNVVAANLLTSNLEPSALLAHILSAFRIEPAGAGKSAEIEAFEDFLFDQMNRGRRVLLIVDEAQNLPLKTIEELRMLSNMDYDGTPLFQVFLIGQPEFRATVARREMEQLRQRVIATYHLNPLDADETRDYILHRLALVGWKNNPAIAPDAFAAIYAASGGVPRRINSLCNRLFLFCALENRDRLDAAVVRVVAEDMASELGAGAAASAETLDEVGTADEPPPFVTALDEAEASPPAASEVAEAPALVAEETEAPVTEQAVDAPAPSVETVTPAPPIPTGPTPSRAFSMFDRLKAAKSGAPIEPPSPVAAPSASALTEEPPQPEAGFVDGFASESVEAEAAAALFAPADAEPPAGATLDDVARAIAAAQPEPVVGEPAIDAAAPAADAMDARDLTAPAPEPEILLSADDAFDEQAADALLRAEARSWRKAVLASISETRDELREAHSQVVRLRRRMLDIDRRRAERRNRVAANLDRAESILGEIRNVWR